MEYNPKELNFDVSHIAKFLICSIWESIQVNSSRDASTTLLLAVNWLLKVGNVPKSLLICSINFKLGPTS